MLQLYLVFNRGEDPLKSDLWDEFQRFCQKENLADSPLAKALGKTQEAAMDDDCLCLAIRPKVAQWNYVCFCFTTREIKEISVADFLAFKEKLVQGNIAQPVLEFDLQPFERDFPEISSASLVNFFKRCATDKDYWQQIAEGGLQRVKNHYTWRLYAKRLLSLTCMYGFWKYATNLERQETSRYLEMLYHLQFRRLAAEMEH